MKKALCILLSLLMVLSLAGCEGERSVSLPDLTQGEPSLWAVPTLFEDPFAPARPADLRFSQIPDSQRSDIEPLRQALAEMEAICGQRDALPRLQELYRFCYQEVTAVKNEASVASVRYDMDSENPLRMEQSLRAAALQAEAVTLYEETLKKVLASSNGKKLREYMGPDVAALFDDRQLDYDRLALLMKQEDGLIKQYDLLRGSSLSEEERSRQLASLYIELVELRREIAAIYGYTDTARYYYTEYYSREYAPGEVTDFHQGVKTHLVPALQRINRSFNGITDGIVASPQVLPLLEEYLPRISEDLAALCSTMTEQELCFLTDNCGESRSAAYTMKLFGYAAPFVYSAGSSRSYRTLTNTVHEFGHYCDLSLNGIYGAKSPGWIYDLSEVCSSGLEVLFYSYYDEIFKGSAGEEKAAFLCGFLELIVLGCMYDEAQQRIFACGEELTPLLADRIFTETAAEYGYPANSAQPYFWTKNLHNYRYPFYYLSYAVAYTTSAELWLLEQGGDRQAAVDAYLRLLSVGSFEYGYTEAVEAAGLRGFRSEGLLEQLACMAEAEITALLKT